VVRLKYLDDCISKASIFEFEAYNIINYSDKNECRSKLLRDVGFYLIKDKKSWDMDKYLEKMLVKIIVGCGGIV
jgi:hypothetical protein